MKTLKSHLDKANVNSKQLRKILTNYSHKECVRIALYCAEDCLEFEDQQIARETIDLVKKWFVDDKRFVDDKIPHRTFDFAKTTAFYAIAATLSVGFSNQHSNAVEDVIEAYSSACSYFAKSKRTEYKSYARLFAYEDLSFPYRKESETFNLDDSTDLNIFLDFLTDHYPTAITYPREEYFTKKLAKEELKILYQA